MSTLQLIENLRSEIKKLIPSNELYRGKLADWKLSKYLGQTFSQRKDNPSKYNSFIQDIINRIRGNKTDKNSAYTFSIEKLNEFKENLKNLFGDTASKCIDYINRYKKVNKLKVYSNQQWNLYNPNLKVHYFDLIDTIEKAYWLGFLMADGYLNKGKYKVSKIEKEKSGRTYRTRYTIGVELSIKDQVLLEQFCDAIGLDKGHIKHRQRTGNDGVTRDFVYINFENKLIAKALNRFKLSGSKIELKNVPDFFGISDGPTSRELTLAWLRGYYDGDGFSGQTRIGSANRELLESIKTTLNIKYPIQHTIEKYEYIDGERKLHKINDFWGLTLGIDIFIEMSFICYDSDPHRSYHLGLERKHHPTFKKALALRDLKVSLEEMGFDKEKFQDLVFNSKPFEIIKILSVSQEILKNLIKNWDIKLPKINLWKDFYPNYYKNNFIGK